MIDTLRSWLTSVILVTMLLSLIQVVLPKGSVQSIASFTGGLILLLALLRPLLGADVSDLLPDLRQYQAEIDRRQEELEQVELSHWEQSIAERTEAYILDKAARLGWEGTVRVQVEPSSEGLPVPSRLEWFGPYCRELEQELARELGIPAERQVWNARKN